jgi:hypothetical protein
MKPRLLQYFTNRLRREPDDRYVVADYNGQPVTNPISREEARKYAKRWANTYERAFVVTNERTGQGESVEPDRD